MSNLEHQFLFFLDHRDLRNTKVQFFDQICHCKSPHFLCPCVRVLTLLLLQICITTSTSAGLDQILPWMFYHKVLGVSTFFLFVEGKAATPSISKVLESIPVSTTTSLRFHYLFCFGCISLAL